MNSYVFSFFLLSTPYLATNRPEQLIGILINSARKPRFIRVKPLFTKTVRFFLLDTLVDCKLFLFYLVPHKIKKALNYKLYIRYQITFFTRNLQTG